jgi:hypothetical protein
MAADFSPLTNEVSELTSVDDAITADNLSDNSNVAQLAASFAAEKTKLADAVARNTPAAEPEGGEVV